MYMRVDPGTRRPPHVHSEIDPVRRVRLGDGRLRLSCQFHHFVPRRLAGLVQCRDMLVRNDHQVAGPVRIGVEDDKIKLGTLEDEIVLIACRVVKYAAEDARVGFRVASYVLISPRTPEYVHRPGFMFRVPGTRFQVGEPHFQPATWNLGPGTWNYTSP